MSLDLPRIHGVEIEDQPWLPNWFRGYLTDCLRLLFSAFLDRTPVVARLADLLERTGERRLVDLCSGSAGPMQQVVRRLRELHHLEVSVRLTDLFPNQEAFEALRRDSSGQLDGVDRPIDARAVPPDLAGARTLFSGFHHFRPDEARAILADAVRHRRPIAVFEASERHPRMAAVLPLLPLAVFAMTPWLEPKSLRRAALTYGLPLVPLFVFWDGVISCLRTYTVSELEAMATEVAAPDYRFEVGRDPVRGLPAGVTWLLGWPQSADHP